MKMKAREIADRILLHEYVDLGKTVDRIYMGDGEREVTRVATCMVITPSVLRAALEWGAEMIINHEPSFRGDSEEYIDAAPYRYKRELLEQSKTVVLRWHDSPHYGDIDYVSLALIKRMNWEGEFDGKFVFTLRTPKTPLEIAKDIRAGFGIREPRIIGCRDGEVRKIGIQLGQRAMSVFTDMLHNDIDLTVAGELCEWYCGEPIRDMAELGIQKSIIVLGHAGSEKDAMADLADRINAEMGENGIISAYFDCGELYSYID